MPYRLFPGLVGWAVALAVFAFGAAAQAQRMPTCLTVEISGEPGKAAHRIAVPAFRALVRSELDRHRSHVTRSEGCSAEVSVELIHVGSHRYVTARINWQVPHRVEVEDDDLPAALGELMTIVLHNDPMRLRGPGERRGFQAGLRRLKRDSVTFWGIEAFQLVGVLGSGPESVPGFAARVRRELEQWHVGVRVSAAFRPHPLDEGLELRLVGNVSFELAHFFSGEANTSGYFTGLIGPEHHWLTGPYRTEPTRADDVNSTGLAFGLRGGVELFRFTATRMDLFAQATIPAFVTSDEEERVMKRWFPTFSAGAGAMF